MFARVVVDVEPAHLDRPFDYVIPTGVELPVGHRVKVPFAGRKRPGWVVDIVDQPAVATERVHELAPWGALPWFDDADLRLFRWVARRYAAPLAHVLRHALPPRVAGVERDLDNWGAPPARTQATVAPEWSKTWASYDAGELLQAVTQARLAGAGQAFWWRSLPGDDANAMVCELIAATLQQGHGAVVIAPDPRSPLVESVKTAFDDVGGNNVVGDHRSARADRTRYRAFLRGRTGHVRVAVGERSGVFAPVPHLGLVVVDDEASPVWKEQRSPRHHAREVALARARMAGAVCVLRSDLPSAQLWRLLSAGHVRAVVPARGIERGRRPRVDIVDLGSPKPGVRRARLSPQANRGLADVVAEGNRAIVLASRGGIGAALACTRCGQRRECPVCAGSVRPHGSDAARATWECPSCGWHGRAFACKICADMRTAPLAAGAARLTDELQRGHPVAQVVRMEGFDAPGPDRTPAIAVMTRGSVVDQPEWLAGQQARLVVAPDADGMLSRPDVDGAEDTLRLWFAVARLTGRMIVQTREPDHHAVQALVRWDPQGFWASEAPRRAELGFPPANSLVRVTAPRGHLDDVGALLRAELSWGAEIVGPTPEGTWLLKTNRLWDTLPPLYALRQRWDKAGSGVRIDVDPLIETWS